MRSSSVMGMGQKGELEPLARPDLRVIGIGYAALDYLAIVPRMPRFDEAEAVEVSGWQVSGGGPASTALVQLARLGVPAGYLGQLGDDVVGRQIRQDLERYGVDLRFLRLDPGMTSPAVMVLVEAGTGSGALTLLVAGSNLMTIANPSSTTHAPIAPSPTRLRTR